MGDEIPFKKYERRQGQLLPGFVGDALDPSDPVFFVDDVVGELDLRGFERRYAVLGERAYPPRMLLKLWFGAIAGVYGGREIAAVVLGPAVPAPGRRAAAGLPEDQPVSGESPACWLVFSKTSG